MATAIINSQMDAINESFSNISSDLTTIRPLLKNAAIGAYPTDSASGSIASFTDGANDVPVKELTVNIEPVQSGTGDPSPTNVRPISGHTEVNVYRTGKNLFSTDKAIADSNSAGVYKDGEWIRFVTDGASRLVYNFKTAQPLAFSLTVKSNVATANNITFNAVYSDGTEAAICGITTTDTNEHNISGIMSTGKTLVRIRTSYSSAKIAYAKDIQLEFGTTATDYEPYAGQTYNIPLGQTVYGGTLNVTSGVLTVDREIMTYDGNQTWTAYGDQGYYIARNDMKKSTAYSTLLVCDKLQTFQHNYGNDYKTASYGITGWSNTSSAGQNYLYAKFGSASATTWADAKAWLQANPITVVYPLATPPTVQLTATQVSTLLGANNIFADAGEISVVYRADTGLYINKMIANALNA